MTTDVPRASMSEALEGVGRNDAAVGEKRLGGWDSLTLDWRLHKMYITMYIEVLRGQETFDRRCTQQPATAHS